MVDAREGAAARPAGGTASSGSQRDLGDRLGTSTADDPVYVAGQGHRVPLERRLPDPPRLHGDLGDLARAGAGGGPPVRHAQGRRAEGDPAADRVDLPAARVAAGGGGPAGGRHPRAVPDRDLRRAGAGPAGEEPLAPLRPDPAHLRAQGGPRADPEGQDRRRADQDPRPGAADGQGPGRPDRGQGQGGPGGEAHPGGDREDGRRGRPRPARRRPGRSRP